jgi:hypothetical protein
MAGTLTVSGLVAGLVSGEKVIGPETMVGATTIGQIDDVVLISDDNTVVVPSGAVAVVIVFPSSNAAACRLRSSGDASDAGLPVGPQGFAAFPVAGLSSLILSASGSGACEISFI